MSRSFAWLALLVVALFPALAAAQAPPKGAGPTFPPAGNPGPAGKIAPGAGKQPAGPAAPGQQAGPPVAKPMGVPFILTDEEQAVLDLVLRRWQSDSAQINNLHCDIEVWENNPVFKKKTHTMGELKYEKPDKGLYHIKFDASGPAPVPTQSGPHWVCNGKAIYEFRYQDKVMVENRLPPSIQGEALVHSPLPFLFGAQAEELKKRYFLKDTTTPQEREKGQIWLLAFPKYQADAANFIKAELILTQQTVPGFKSSLLLPYGLKMYLPNDQSDSSHVFKNYKVNDKTWLDIIVKNRTWSPRPPASDWEHRVEEAPEDPGAPVEKPKSKFFNPLKLGTRPGTTTKK